MKAHTVSRKGERDELRGSGFVQMVVRGVVEINMKTTDDLVL